MFSNYQAHQLECSIVPALIDPSSYLWLYSECSWTHLAFAGVSVARACEELYKRKAGATGLGELTLSVGSLRTGVGSVAIE